MPQVNQGLTWELHSHPKTQAAAAAASHCPKKEELDKGVMKGWASDFSGGGWRSEHCVGSAIVSWASCSVIADVDSPRQHGGRV